MGSKRYTRRRLMRRSVKTGNNEFPPHSAFETAGKPPFSPVNGGERSRNFAARRSTPPGAARECNGSKILAIQRAQAAEHFSSARRAVQRGDIEPPLELSPNVIAWTDEA